MDLTIWCLIFGVLTCLNSAASGQAFLIPGPENVTVDCDNFDTIVYWNYSDLLIGTLFQVEFKSDIGNKNTFKTEAHHVNITSRLNNTNYAVYTIRIRAQNVTHTSKFSSPVRFAFDNRMEGDIICNLDFPPVTLKYEYGDLTLSFQNPLHLYENTPALKYLKKNTDPNLETSNLSYEVVDQSNRATEFTCPYEKSVCAETLHISAKKDHYCVNVSGSIVRANVRAAKFCYNGPEKGRPLPSHIVAIVFAMVLIGTIIFLAALVSWKTRAKTHPIPTPHVPPLTERRPVYPDPPGRSESVDILWVDSSLSVTSEDPLLSDHSSSSCRSSAHCSCFISPGRVQTGASLASDDVERDTELTGWSIERSSQDLRLLETSGGTLSSDDSPHAYDIFVDLRPRGRDGVDAEEEVRYSEGKTNGHPANQESSGGTALSGYDSSHGISVELEPGDCVDGYTVDRACSESEDMERDTESTNWSSERSAQDLRDSEVSGGTVLSDYDSPHNISVELGQGDFVDGYTARKRLA
ncbi:interferon gamma receptor 1 isoform X1 [Alosa sapidissima]|uniref:interferon gamma receptor 1 isoform X1 n=1 Tax=Alosa sapidissima TaxID=34773 RepID=UPI001C0884EE|nr:interferon gamma receptor 1 isoform X1 [Alosa sapidissima]